LFPEDAGMSGAGLRLAYVVHDLGDPVVARRLDMLRPYLADAVVIGFHGATVPAAAVAGWPTVPLGRTEDARLGRRVLSVLQARLRLSAYGAHVAGANVVMSRQMETRFWPARCGPTTRHRRCWRMNPSTCTG
jgi:succinoglycan biosynthesis protein ExoL